jgi:hypothetical protein
MFLHRFFNESRYFLFRFVNYASDINAGQFGQAFKRLAAHCAGYARKGDGNS